MTKFMCFVTVMYFMTRSMYFIEFHVSHRSLAHPVRPAKQRVQPSNASSLWSVHHPSILLPGSSGRGARAEHCPIYGIWKRICPCPSMRLIWINWPKALLIDDACQYSNINLVNKYIGSIEIHDNIPYIHERSVIHFIWRSWLKYNKPSFKYIGTSWNTSTQLEIHIKNLQIHEDILKYTKPLWKYMKVSKYM